MRGVATVFGVALAALLAGGAWSARATTYSLTATKSCLVRKGTQLQSPQTGAQATLPAAERLESLVGTLPGNEPLFLYMAVARSSSQAVAIRKALEKTIVPNPTSADSWSGQKANAAWIVVSIAGTSPGAGARKLVLSCLTRGRPPAAPGRYAKDDVALCMQSEGRAVVVPASQEELLLGTAVPAKLVPHLLFAFTSTSATVKDGLRLFALFGRTHADALALRTRLDKALDGKVLGPAVWTGSKKNVAWAASRIRGTTLAGISSGKRTFLSCLP